MQRNKICNKNEGMQSQRIKDLGLALRNVNSYREKRTQILQLKKKICQKVNRESRFVRPQKKRGGKTFQGSGEYVLNATERWRKMGLEKRAIARGNEKAVSDLWESRIRRLIWSETRFQRVQNIEWMWKMKAASRDQWFQMLVCERKAIGSNGIFLLLQETHVWKLSTYLHFP